MDTFVYVVAIGECHEAFPHIAFASEQDAETYLIDKDFVKQGSSNHRRSNWLYKDISYLTSQASVQSGGPYDYEEASITALPFHTTAGKA